MKREVANISHFMAQSRRTSAAAAAGPIKPRFKPRFGSPSPPLRLLWQPRLERKERRGENKFRQLALSLSLSLQPRANPILFDPSLTWLDRCMKLLQSAAAKGGRRREIWRRRQGRWLHSSFMTMLEMRVPYVETQTFCSTFLESS